MSVSLRFNDRHHRNSLPSAPASIFRLLERPIRKLQLALSALLLLGLFSTEIADPDFWWHLRTGEYIATAHRLPVPDPFAYTTAMARPAYRGDHSSWDS